MDNEIKLTLDENEEAKEPVLEITKIENEIEKAKPEVTLTDEEQKMVDEFSKKIDLKNSNQVLQYGAGAQSKIAGFSEKTLNSVRTKDLGEVGDLLSNVVSELKNFEIDEKEKGITAFFKKNTNKIMNLKNKYEKAETNVDTIAKVLENHQVQLLKDIANLDQMYDLNKSYYKEISMYIMAGRQKLEEARTKELPALIEKASGSNLPTDAQELNDFQSSIDRFDKKIHDLDLTRTVALQMAPQIRMIQASNTVMVEKIQSTIVNTIPLWKSQMVLALSAAHTGQAAKATKDVTNLTNELLKKNADNLKMATVETAREAERSVVDIETLKHTNEQLISALSEVRNIQIEGRAKRREAEQEMVKLESDLKKSLIEIATKER
ncbi:toxic anion resistance protein [Peptoniphilus duerdenii]|uniref:toxic anion resistance protein n=1 Tax=Peptoniphilus duerdenii TaxID=507750 RepID=UPI0023F07D16|nr:toxic anion resistance protein [Peptoniphilus duerdenii]